MHKHSTVNSDCDKIANRLLPIQPKIPVSTNFGRKYGVCRLWKKLWIVCITICMEWILWRYGNEMYNVYSHISKLFYKNCSI